MNEIKINMSDLGKRGIGIVYKNGNDRQYFSGHLFRNPDDYKRLAALISQFVYCALIAWYTEQEQNGDVR